MKHTRARPGYRRNGLRLGSNQRRPGFRVQTGRATLKKIRQPRRLSRGHDAQRVERVPRGRQNVHPNGSSPLAELGKLLKQPLVLGLLFRGSALFSKVLIRKIDRDVVAVEKFDD